jgi:hypothetical protein
LRRPYRPHRDLHDLYFVRLIERLWMSALALATTIAGLLLIVVPTMSAPVPLNDNRTVEGIASTYGPGYNGWLALPEGKGFRVRICSTATGICAVRTSNDAGPSKAMQRAGRVADLDVATFEALCLCNWRSKGLIRVTVEYLGKGPSVTPPPTDRGDLSWRTRPRPIWTSQPM